MTGFQDPLSTLSRPPQKIGRFQIMRELGQGAQSVVYLAFDPQLHREVAVKALRGAADAAEALLNEARAVSRLSHPAIIPVFEAAQAQGDTGAYLVFEYVEGPTLSELLRQQGVLEPTLAVRTLLPVLDAVAYAHAHQVIHRDLKPSNILMDRRGIARVMDFGIAVRQIDKPVDDRQADSPGHQLALIGTPAYMAPEYIQEGRVSPQTDVFAAGLVLFEMLSGRRAVQADSGFQAIQFLVSQDIHLPAVLPFRVDDRLRVILDHALARDPALRYPQMADLAAALRDWLAPPSSSGETGVGGAGDSDRSSSGLSKAGAASAPATAQDVALEAALRRIRLKGEFPALPSSLARITRLAASEQQNLQALAAAVLSDAALTQKLLRTVNAATYRSFGGGAVSTVSRAIQLLGYGAIRTAVTSLPLLDLGKDPVQAGRVLDEILLAAFCGSLAQDLSGLFERDAEEAFVCGSLHRLGPMLLTFYFPEEAAEIDRLAQQRPGQRASHVLQVLGLDDEALAVGVARLWGLPELLTRSMRAIADPVSVTQAGTVATRVPVVKPVTRAELLRTLSAFAAELASAWMLASPERRQAATGAASQRYAKALVVTPAEIRAALDAAEAVVKALLLTVQHDLGHSEVACRLGLAVPRGHPAADITSGRANPHAALARPAMAAAPAAVGRGSGPDRTQTLAGISLVTPAPPGTHVEAATPDTGPSQQAQCHEQLAQGVQDLASRLLQEVKLNDLLRDVLNVLQRAAGFRRVVFCIREVRTAALVERVIAHAPGADERRTERLRIALDDPHDSLGVLTAKGADVWIAGFVRHRGGSGRAGEGLQPELSGGLLLLPMLLKGQVMGLICAEGDASTGQLLDEKTLALMGTLRNQLVLAFRQRTF